MSPQESQPPASRSEGGQRSWCFIIGGHQEKQSAVGGQSGGFPEEDQRGRGQQVGFCLHFSFKKKKIVIAYAFH